MICTDKKYLKIRNRTKNSTDDEAEDQEPLQADETTLQSDQDIYKMLERMDKENAMNKTKDFSFKQKILYIITRVRYVSALLTITFIFLISSGLQYWITDYAKNVIGIS